MGTPYRDWIPDGADTGAQGEVFKDFVPPVQPVKKEEIKTEAPEQPVSLKCEKCGFVAKTEFGLKSHMRKHA